jgi:hypothetical protein
MRSTPAAVTRLAYLCGALTIAAACHGKNPVGPTETNTVTVTQSIAVSGTLSLRQPGDTGQLSAIATLSDGTTRNVTAFALWSGGTRLGDNVRVVSVTQAGLVTAVDFGQTTIGVSYGGTSGTMPVRVAPDGAFLVEGTVTEAGRKVDRVTVEAVSALGAFGTTTSASGVFVLPGAGAVTIQASRYGYNAAVIQTTVDRDTQVTLDLQQLAQPGTIPGRYTMTFIASPSCSFPPEARQRTYGALIEDARTYHASWDLDVQLDGATFFDDSGWELDPGFVGYVDGNTVRFTMGEDSRGAFAFNERIGNVTMRYSGVATGAVSGTRIATTLDGTVVMGEIGSPTTVVVCRAADHQLVFVR